MKTWSSETKPFFKNRKSAQKAVFEKFKLSKNRHGVHGGVSYIFTNLNLWKMSIVKVSVRM